MAFYGTNMPRTRRYYVSDHVYHLTHRCHDREFLLKFGLDRSEYRKRLREALKEFKVSLLSYCITSNHVHLLTVPHSPDELSRFMQKLDGDFAQAFNLRKSRTGAFWGDRYHSTLVDNGQYLWACLKYIDLNMVRAGVAKHPEDWEWTGYRELIGKRRRYRLINRDLLFDRLGVSEPSHFEEVYSGLIMDALKSGERARDAKWTEAMAVGSEAFLERIQPQFTHRRRLTCTQEESSPSAWILKEPRNAYGSFSTQKIAAKV